MENRSIPMHSDTTRAQLGTVGQAGGNDSFCPALLLPLREVRTSTPAAEHQPGPQQGRQSLAGSSESSGRRALITRTRPGPLCPPEFLQGTGKRSRPYGRMDKGEGELVMR